MHSSAGLLLALLVTPTDAMLRSALRATRPLLQDNWLFSYADTSPISPSDPEGLAFLATNAGFAATGAALATHDPSYGALLECATAASIGYHYTQLRLGGNPQRQVVQLAILIDYIFAIPSLIIGGGYAASLGDALPVSVPLLGAAAFATLIAGWFFDAPREYLVLHGLWHIFSAAAGWELSTVL